jgi:hypothetical protein
VAVEFTVSVEVLVPTPPMLTVAGTLQVIGLVAPEGAFVTEHDRLTTPAKLPEGIAEIAVVFPVVAPASIAIAPAASVRAGCVRVTTRVPVDPR